MKLFSITADLSKPYSEWEAGFISHQPKREAAGIVDVAHGKIEGQEAILVVLKAESQATLDAFMAAQGESIQENGHVMESTQITVAE